MGSSKATIWNQWLLPRLQGRVTFEQVGAAHVARDGAHVLVLGHEHHTGLPWSQVEQVGGYAAVRLREIRPRFPTDCPGCMRGWTS